MIDYKKIGARFIPVDQETESEKWLELRKTGIGGSDAGAIMELNKYASPLTIFFSKMGIDGFEGNASTKWGHLLEDPIRNETRKDLNVEIITVPGMYRSLENPVMNANLDGLMYTESLTIDEVTVSGVGGHEIKTSASGDGFTTHEIPDSYYCQVQHYMAVTNLDWFVLTVFILSTKTLKHYIVKRNDEFIDVMIKKELDFWNNHVETKIPPEPTGLESENVFMKSLPVSESVELDPEMEKVIEREEEIKEQIKTLTKEQDVLKEQIIMAIYCKSLSETSENCNVKAGKFQITYNTQKRKTVDSDKLKKAGIYDTYTKTTESRVMRIKEVK